MQDLKRRMTLAFSRPMWQLVASCTPTINSRRFTVIRKDSSHTFASPSSLSQTPTSGKAWGICSDQKLTLIKMTHILTTKSFPHEIHNSQNSSRSLHYIQPSWKHPSSRSCIPPFWDFYLSKILTTQTSSPIWRSQLWAWSSNNLLSMISTDIIQSLLPPTFITCNVSINAGSYR